MAKKTNKLPVASNSYPTDVCKPYKPSKEEQDRQRRYAAEDALRTCEQYEKNKSDKQLMSDVKKLAQEKMADLKKVVK